jgi:hypothetical protein
MTYLGTARAGLDANAQRVTIDRAALDFMQPYYQGSSD